MKKLLLIGALALVTLFSNAQDGLMGTSFVGGTFSYHDKGEDSDSYAIKPMFGTFISPSVAVGGALGYIHSKDGSRKTNEFEIMPFARKYWNLTGKLYFFGEVALPIAFGNDKDVVGTGTEAKEKKTNNFRGHLAFNPGFDLFVNSWFSVEAKFNVASIGFESSKPKGGDSSTTWGFGGLDSTDLADITVGVKFLF